MSKHFFFITGLPRSRTAWMANLLTFGDSFCYHDAMRDGGGVAALKDLLINTDAEHVGHSDPANILVWKQLHNSFPEARWVVIHRPPEESFESSKRAFGGANPDAFQSMRSKLHELSMEVKPIYVPFAKLSELALGVAHHLGIDVGGRRRLDMLRDMQVQIEPNFLKRKIAELKEAA